jgi:mannose-6-phosphate isomerase-like protein (cupin superfamily)
MAASGMEEDGMELEKQKTLRPTPVSLRIPLLAKGMSKHTLSAGDNSTVRVHCYSTGMGEKHGLHAHLEEEHLFLVLHGRVQFSDLDGKLPVLAAHQALWIPKGCFYEFYNPGPGPLVILRFGACQKGADESIRVDPEGHPIAGRSSQNPELARPVIVDGAYFGCAS